MSESPPLQRQNMMAAFHKWNAELPPAWRTTFNLHVVDGYSLREVAEMLEANEATIRSHFLRGRQQLQKLIKQHYPHISSTNVGYYETR